MLDMISVFLVLLVARFLCGDSWPLAGLMGPDVAVCMVSGGLVLLLVQWWLDLNSRAVDWGSQDVPELMPARWWLRVSQTVLASGWGGQVFTQLALEPWYSQGWCLWGPGSLGACPCPLVAESGLRASSCPWWMELGSGVPGYLGCLGAGVSFPVGRLRPRKPWDWCRSAGGWVWSGILASGPFRSQSQCGPAGGMAGAQGLPGLVPAPSWVESSLMAGCKSLGTLGLVIHWWLGRGPGPSGGQDRLLEWLRSQWVLWQLAGWKMGLCSLPGNCLAWGDPRCVCQSASEWGQVLMPVSWQEEWKWCLPVAVSSWWDELPKMPSVSFWLLGWVPDAFFLSGKLCKISRWVLSRLLSNFCIFSGSRSMWYFVCVCVCLCVCLLSVESLFPTFFWISWK